MITGKFDGVIAEFTRFQKYLASVDPASRGWIFNNHRLRSEDMIMHPGFKKKIEKYHLMWDEFRRQGFAVPELPLPRELLELRQVCERF